MSGLHFEIRSDGEKVALKNHSRTNQTQVNGAFADILVLKAGDVITAGQTEFVVSAQGSQSPRVQDWIFNSLPPGWEIVPEQGLKHLQQASNLPVLMVSEDRLPNGYDLERYVDLQLKLLGERLPSAKASKGSASVPGAQTAAGLTIRTPFPDGRIAIQKQVYATVDSKVGILTATAMETDPAGIHQGIQQILAIATFEPAAVPPR